MSNLEKASRCLQDWADVRGVEMDMYHAARRLLEADLLAPDLPEPEARHLEEVGTDILAWKSDHIEVGVYKNRIAMDDPPKPAMAPFEARELALMLLAAADYAEKEQDNE